MQKRYPGSRVRVERSGGIFSPVREQLMIAGSVGITSYLCFIESDLPIFGTQQMRGVHILGPKATVKALLVPGELNEDDRKSLHRQLAEALPAA